jgi:hypothetical protein
MIVSRGDNEMTSMRVDQYHPWLWATGIYNIWEKKTDCKGLRAPPGWEHTVKKGLSKTFFYSAASCSMVAKQTRTV